jgi:hypothetical protein
MTHKIPLVFENWSEQYNWWLPNNWPTDFIIHGHRRLPASHDWMWFDVGENQALRQAYNDLSYFDLHAKQYDHLIECTDVEYCDLKAISNQRYIYPIMLRTFDYFAVMRDYGFNFVCDRVKNDVRNGQAKIILIHPLEGWCGNPDWIILDKWCRENNFTKQHVHFIHGNFATPPESYNFSYWPVSNFQINWPMVENVCQFMPVDERFLYLSYNRRSRQHRMLMACELQHNNLLSKGLISYHNPDKNVQHLIALSNRPDLLNSARELDNMPELTLDRNLGEYNPSGELNLDHHNRTFLSLVTETLTEHDIKYKDPNYHSFWSPIFFSEKTWKPISAGQPFIILASAGHLKYLKTLGYKTFDKWWSEEYDQIADLNLKCKMIIEILQKLAGYNIEQLKVIRDEMTEVLKHNQQVYNNFRLKHNNDFNSPVYEIVKTIYDSN